MQFRRRGRKTQTTLTCLACIIATLRIPCRTPQYTDTSLIEAFYASATLFDPALLLVFISLKEDIVDRIKQKLRMAMTQTHGGSGSSSSKPPNMATDGCLTFRDARGRGKRAFYEEDDDNLK